MRTIHKNLTQAESAIKVIKNDLKLLALATNNNTHTKPDMTEWLEKLYKELKSHSRS